MATNKKNQNDLETGDNPEERKNTSGKVKKVQGNQNKEQDDLESGDNPEERKRRAPK